VSRDTFDTLGALKNNHRIKIAKSKSWSGADVQTLPPWHVEIQPTSRCMRKCVFCSHTLRNRRGGELLRSEVFGLLEEWRKWQPKKISFSGGGEPLEWQSGNLADVIEQAAQIANVSLTTNGDRLWSDHENTLSKECLQILPHCDSILLNVPAVEQASFKKQVVGGASWSTTERLLRTLINLKQTVWSVWRGKSVELRCAVIVNTMNVDDLVHIDATLNDWGIDQIYFKRLKAFEKRDLEPITVEVEDLVRRLQATDQLTWSSNLRRFWTDLTTGTEPGGPCWMTRLGFGAIIDPLGEVYLCTPTVGKEEFSIGNVREKSFHELWVSSRRREVLHKLGAMSESNECPEECRYHRYNQMINYIQMENTIPNTTECIEAVDGGFEICL
jgi:radical SAM protein with 4Fe4S-binding SPASM domain